MFQSLIKLAENASNNANCPISSPNFTHRVRGAIPFVLLSNLFSSTLESCLVPDPQSLHGHEMKKKRGKKLYFIKLHTISIPRLSQIASIKHDENMTGKLIWQIQLVNYQFNSAKKSNTQHLPNI